MILKQELRFVLSTNIGSDYLIKEHFVVQQLTYKNKSSANLIVALNAGTWQDHTGYVDRVFHTHHDLYHPSTVGLVTGTTSPLRHSLIFTILLIKIFCWLAFPREGLTWVTGRWDKCEVLAGGKNRSQGLDGLEGSGEPRSPRSSVNPKSVSLKSLSNVLITVRLVLKQDRIPYESPKTSGAVSTLRKFMLYLWKLNSAHGNWCHWHWHQWKPVWG